MLSVAAIGDTVSVPINDKSVPASPLENAGTVTLSQFIEESNWLMSHAEEWTVRNRSSKSIVTIIETLLVHYSNGRSEEIQSQYELFFSPDPLKPGSTTSFSSTRSSPRTVSPLNHSQPLTTPSSEVFARWVQFDDGTTFGDGTYAKQLLLNRKAILDALKQLDKIYDSKGPDEFAQQLQQQPYPSPDVNGYIEHIRRVQAHEGTEKAIQTLRMHLKTGEFRMATF